MGKVFLQPEPVLVLNSAIGLSCMYHLSSHWPARCELRFMSQTDITPSEALRKLVQKGMALLVRREHSCVEMAQKLKPLADRLGYADQIAEAVTEMVDAGYLSDERFADMLVRSRIAKGHGPLRIRQELQHKGVERQLAEQAIAQNEPDWFALAASVRERRFSLDQPVNQKEQGRQMRFLGARGFSHEQIQYALEKTESDA